MFFSFSYGGPFLFVTQCLPGSLPLAMPDVKLAAVSAGTPFFDGLVTTALRQAQGERILS
jgi:hypothetical protein